MNGFFKWWTIANTVWQIVGNFVQAGGPTVQPGIVAQEAQKDLQRRVEAGYLPGETLNGSEAIIQEAIDNHPLIQNFPDKGKKAAKAPAPPAPNNPPQQ